MSGPLAAQLTLLSIDRNGRSPTKGAEMFSAAYKKCLATAVVIAALAIVLPVSGAFAQSNVAPPPSSIAASAEDEYQSLRAPGQQPTVEEPSEPSGFDLVSAAIGAAAAAGLSLALMTVLAVRRPTGRGPASA